MMREYQEGSLWIYMVDSHGVAERIGVTGAAFWQMDAAYDILRDDSVPEDTIVSLISTALRTGENPEKIARKFVELRKAFRS